MTDWEQDLRARWTPSAEQDQAAHQALLDRLICTACERKVMVGTSGTPYHRATGLAGWVDDPTGIDAAHMVVLDPHLTVVTAHLLIGKQRGWWGAGIEVVPLPGVFADRDEASTAIQAAADSTHEKTGLPLTGGWTYHHLSGGEPQRTLDGRVWQTRWAVFEDCLASRPKRKRD